MPQVLYRRNLAFTYSILPNLELLNVARTLALLAEKGYEIHIAALAGGKVRITMFQ